MEEYQIALSPALDIGPAEFVAAWNTEAETRTYGRARLAEAGSKGYF